MSNMDKIFKDRLYDQESPLGANTTFEEVMARRKGRAGGLWYLSKYAIVAGIVILAALIGFLAMPGSESNSSSGQEKQISPANGQVAENSNNNESASNGNARNNQATDNSKSVQGNSNEAFAKSGADNAKATPSNGNSDNFARPNFNREGSPAANPYAAEPAVSVDNTIAQAPMSTPTQAQIAAEARANAEIAAEKQRIALQEAWARSVQENWLRDLGWMTEKDFPAYRDNELAIVTETPVAGDVNLWNNEFSPSDRNSKWFIELNTSTAGRPNNKNNPDGLNIIGNHQFVQYQGLALYDLSQILGKGLIGGLGIGYNMSAGTGRYINTEYRNEQHIDSHTVVIIQPGLPDRTITVYDTSMQNNAYVSKGDVNYSLSKVNLPIAMRWYFGSGRFIFRLGGSIAPGVMVSRSGTVFSKKEMAPTSNLKSRAFTMDSRLSLGLQYAISNKLSMFAEPTIEYQLCGNRAWMPYNRLGYGFGVGLLIKP